MSFPYEHVLMIGATSGIGAAMATRLINGGTAVTAVGRRQDRLDEFVNEHSQSKTAEAKAVAFDIGKLDLIPGFAADITQASPSIDCVFLNAGIQRGQDFSHPEKVNLSEFNTEITVNFSSFVAFTQAFLPFLMKKKSKTGLIFTTSNLAIVPLARCPAYSASKAALNAFILCLREQLRDMNVKIIEVSPPVVQTELHDTNMGVSAGRALGMPLLAFTEEAYAGLTSGSDQVIVGSIGPKEKFMNIVAKRRAAFEALTKMMQGEK